jgi:hypothetical protein
MPNIYFFGGHGRDDEAAFCDPPESHPGCRRLVPRGTVLVTVNETGDRLDGNYFLRMLKFFQKPGHEQYLAFPQKYARQLAAQFLVQHLNVYPPGSQMPDLTFNPFDEMTVSGVLKYPIRPDPPAWDITAVTIDDVREDTGDLITPDFIHAYFQDSLYPTPESLIPYIGRKFDLKKSKRHVYDLMKQLGPGVYYFGICRVSNTEREFRTEYEAVTGKDREFASTEEAYAALPQTADRRRKFAKYKLRRSVSKLVQQQREK